MEYKLFNLFSKATSSKFLDHPVVFINDLTRIAEFHIVRCHALTPLHFDKIVTSHCGLTFYKDALIADGWYFDIPQLLQDNVFKRALNIIASEAYFKLSTQEVNRNDEKSKEKVQIYFCNFLKFNFGHVVMEQLAKVLILDRFFPKGTKIELIIPRSSAGNWIPLLELLLPHYVSVKIIDENLISLENIYLIPSTFCRQGTRDLLNTDFVGRLSADIFALRNLREVLRKIGKNENVNSIPFLLYLSREKANHRLVLNQKEVIVRIREVFKDLKLIKVCIEDLSYSDQIALITNATVIVEEGGGSTALTSLCSSRRSPYILFASRDRTSEAGKVFLGLLQKSVYFISCISESQKKGAYSDPNMTVPLVDLNLALVRAKAVITSGLEQYRFKDWVTLPNILKT